MALTEPPRTAGSKRASRSRRRRPGLGPGSSRSPEALGVSKGGFYWQFDDRRSLLEGMLESWERAGVDDVIERVEGGGGDAREKLRRLFAIAGRELFRTELAIRDWSRRDRTVAARLRRVDNRRMDYMRSLFGEFCADEDEVEIPLHARFFGLGRQPLHGRRTRRPHPGPGDQGRARGG